MSTTRRRDASMHGIHGASPRNRTRQGPRRQERTQRAAVTLVGRHVSSPRRAPSRALALLPASRSLVVRQATGSPTARRRGGAH